MLWLHRHHQDLHRRRGLEVADLNGTHPKAAWHPGLLDGDLRILLFFKLLHSWHDRKWAEELCGSSSGGKSAAMWKQNIQSQHKSTWSSRDAVKGPVCDISGHDKNVFYWHNLAVHWNLYIKKLKTYWLPKYFCEEQLYVWKRDQIYRFVLRLEMGLITMGLVTLIAKHFLTMRWCWITRVTFNIHVSYASWWFSSSPDCLLGSTLHNIHSLIFLLEYSIHINVIFKPIIDTSMSIIALSF